MKTYTALDVRTNSILSHLSFTEGLVNELWKTEEGITALAIVEKSTDFEHALSVLAALGALTKPQWLHFALWCVQPCFEVYSKHMHNGDALLRAIKRIKYVLKNDTEDARAYAFAASKVATRLAEQAMGSAMPAADAIAFAAQAAGAFTSTVVGARVCDAANYAVRTAVAVYAETPTDEHFAERCCKSDEVKKSTRDAQRKKLIEILRGDNGTTFY